MIQIVSFTGVYGLTFLIMLVNVALSETVLHGLQALRCVVAESEPATDCPSPPWLPPGSCSPRPGSTGSA